MLSGELDKLAVAGTGEISVAAVDLLCIPSGSQVVWRLTDLIGNRKPAEAIRFFCDRLERGEEPYGMWVILLNMIKNIGAIRMCIDAGVGDEHSISKATGVHFLGVRSLLSLVRSMDHARVKMLLNWAAATDIGLKTGQLKYTAEHPGELIAVAERAILACV